MLYSKIIGSFNLETVLQFMKYDELSTINCTLTTYMELLFKIIRVHVHCPIENRKA